MINKAVVGSPSLRPFHKNRLALLYRYPEVIDVSSVRYGFVRWRYPMTNETRLAVMVGFDPLQKIFTNTDISRKQMLLSSPGRILFDRLSRREFGDIAASYLKLRPTFAFINDQRVRIAGLIRVGTSFSYDASFLASEATYNSVRDTSSSEVEIGLIRLSSEAIPSKFIDFVSSDLPEDVKLYTLTQFLDLEVAYWDNAKPIGFVFGFNMILGFVVGMLILYQILYTDVSEHLSEFATMLALAHSASRLKRIVFFQSSILAFAGYPVGYILSVCLFQFISAFTGLSVRMSADRSIICFIIIFVMSSSSALLAMKKLGDADPIDLFD
jgi:putative ABC transport system permease protein